MSSPLSVVMLLTVLLLDACSSAAQNSDSYQMALPKRGGARSFHGGFYNIPGAKRISEFSPYYLYDKRGGGRAFFGDWQPYDGPSRFYDSPSYYKRSSNLWEFLEGRNTP
ncbi:hypothetical protein DICVIV_00357 [Dictyocaulus viviparus]|uniref:Uncharacterized protein n=1 Tax=Dictyocaulus viviparus TaxID=29172 RepID=A0A0D8YBL2_DICVI|nr:hypothetical protein DICVIV_00357 [Dictyocaulus viviparus]